MKGGPLDDETLVRAARAGDAAAFEELVLRYQDVAFRTAYLVLRDAGEAEDAVQEAFVNCYRALGRFREGAAFRPWLLRIVANRSLNQAKSRKRRAAVAERLTHQGAPGFYSIDETLLDRERARIIWAALESLKERERVVIYLRYFLALPEAEMAEYLECAQGTVKSRLHRALARLHEVLARQHPRLRDESA